MKKIIFFFALVMISVTTLSAQTVHGFLKGTHTNDVYTEKRDLKNIEGEILIRVIPNEKSNFGVLGYSDVNDSTASLAAGVSFLASQNLRFDFAAGVEIDPENSSKNGIFIGRIWIGNVHNDLWGNLWAGERIRYQVIYSHNFTKWLGLGITAEDLKGQGLYASVSPLENFSVFAKAFHNGKSAEKKLGFNLVVDVGATLVF
jgi:hypothetical protein